MREFIDDRINRVRHDIAKLQNDLKTLERQRREIESKRGMNRWVGYEFESSTMRTPEFTRFAADFKNFVREEAKGRLTLVGFTTGHFFVSGFLYNIKTERYVYFSVSDVRFFPDEWYNNVLVRTARDLSDFRGGANYYTCLNDLVGQALRLSS